MIPDSEILIVVIDHVPGVGKRSYDTGMLHLPE